MNLFLSHANDAFSSFWTEDFWWSLFLPQFKDHRLFLSYMGGNGYLFELSTFISFSTLVEHRTSVCPFTVSPNDKKCLDELRLSR